MIFVLTLFKNKITRRVVDGMCTFSDEAEKIFQFLRDLLHEWKDGREVEYGCMVKKIAMRQNSHR